MLRSGTAAARPYKKKRRSEAITARRIMGDADVKTAADARATSCFAKASTSLRARAALIGGHLEYIGDDALELELV